MEKEAIIKQINNVKKWIDFSIWFGIIGGLFAFFHGLWVFIYNEPLVLINLRTQFPIIGNGSIDIVVGLVMLYFSILSLKNRRKLIVHQLVEIDKKVKRKEQQEKDAKNSSILFGNINSKKRKNNTRISNRKPK